MVILRDSMMDQRRLVLTVRDGSSSFKITTFATNEYGYIEQPLVERWVTTLQEARKAHRAAVRLAKVATKPVA